MIESILIALGVVIAGGSVFYLMDKRYKNVFDKLAKAENEATAAKGFQEVAEEQADLYRKKYNEFVTQAKRDIEATKTNLEEKYKKETELKVEKVIRDYEEALKLETEDLEEKVADLDEQLGMKLQEIASKNTMYFTCACDRSKPIPCTIDLVNEQNYFTCPDCGAVYRVVINTSTILMSGISNNPKIAGMYDGVDIQDIGNINDRTPL